jgi:hypothetical protein
MHKESRLGQRIVVRRVQQRKLSEYRHSNIRAAACEELDGGRIPEVGNLVTENFSIKRFELLNGAAVNFSYGPLLGNFPELHNLGDPAPGPGV